MWLLVRQSRAITSSAIFRPVGSVTPSNPIPRRDQKLCCYRKGSRVVSFLRRSLARLYLISTINFLLSQKKTKTFCLVYRRDTHGKRLGCRILTKGIPIEFPFPGGINSSTFRKEIVTFCIVYQMGTSKSCITFPNTMGFESDPIALVQPSPTLFDSRRLLSSWSFKNVLFIEDC